MTSNYLPPELFYHICGFIANDISTLCNISLVTKSSKSIADKDEFWFQHLFERYPCSSYIITKDAKRCLLQMNEYLHLYPSASSKNIHKQKFFKLCVAGFWTFEYIYTCRLSRCWKKRACNSICTKSFCQPL